MKRVLTAMALLLGLPLSAVACLWDRDTPVDEARGLPEVVAVLTGRFERNPPLFYEMRLERVEAHLRSDPTDLAAYDDAGVACDRLGRGDEAISWMERKREQLSGRDAADPAVQEQFYRYHANLGTFLVHRWVRQGADRARIDEVEAARGEIAQALAINPNAHFGREKYQLRALNWIIDPPSAVRQQYLPNLLGWNFYDIYGQETEPQEADDAVRGLAGLVVLGNAWESVDIFHALNIALQRDSLGFERGREGGRNTLAYLAWLRCRELIDAGKGSMLPDPAYAKLRAEADAWQAARTAFMMERLKAGRHPDTDPHFWDGYTERPAPGLPTMSVPEAYDSWRRMQERIGLLVVLGIPAFLVVWLVGRSVRAWRRKVERTDDWSAESADSLR
jgi:tetratricopeptide (TPR) repeat protein